MNSLAFMDNLVSTNNFKAFNLITTFLFGFQMVTVAKSFEAPIKLVMPQDLLENG